MRSLDPGLDGGDAARKGCEVCGRSESYLFERLEVCKGCIVAGGQEVEAMIGGLHAAPRRRLNLPERPPRGQFGRRCALCCNGCRMAPDGVGYCGVRKNAGGRIVGGDPSDDKLSWYYDPLPTNCVASWVCPEQGKARGAAGGGEHIAGAGLNRRG